MATNVSGWDPDAQWRTPSLGEFYVLSGLLRSPSLSAPRNEMEGGLLQHATDGLSEVRDLLNYWVAGGRAGLFLVSQSVTQIVIYGRVHACAPGHFVSKVRGRGPSTR